MHCSNNFIFVVLFLMLHLLTLFSMTLFRTESAFHTELNSVWVDRTKSNSVRPKNSSHVIFFPQISFTIHEYFTVYPPPLLATDLNPNSKNPSNPNPN